MKRIFIPWFAAVAAACIAFSAMAAAVGPPSGLYSFGDLIILGTNSCGRADGVNYSIWFGAVGSNIENVASVLRSNGAGAVKFSTAVPFVVNEAPDEGGSFNINYGAWAIMTFNRGSLSTGTIVFDSVLNSPGTPTPGQKAINFKNYTQDFDSQTESLSVDFTAEFPHCSVLVAGIYEQ
jgi:hypothetical protein